MEKIHKLLQNKKLLWIIGAAVCLLVTAVILISVFAGSSHSDPTEPSDGTGSTGSLSYSLTLKTEGGKILSGVEVFVYADSDLTDLFAVGKTDENGTYGFEGTASGGYYAVLKSVPAGYAWEESYLLSDDTQITLKTKLISGEDLTDLSLKLGDVMFDFTATAVDGTEYTLSQLLKNKKAVVLNFWFTTCPPCQAEFPFLQEAYTQYSDQIALLAINPTGESEDAIRQFCADNGLTLPAAKADDTWANVLGIEYFPTTVVIDRFGTISLIHVGSVDNTQTFADVFSFFSADTYTQQTVSDIYDLPLTEAEQGSAENPYEFGGTTEFEIEVDAGATVYCNVYKVSGMQLTVKDPTVSILYNDQTYTPVDGIVSFGVEAPDTYTPIELAVTNNGNANKTVKVTFGFLPGTMGNPMTLEMGDFSVNVEAGNDQGVYYTYTAAESGVVTLKCNSATAGVDYTFTLYNLNSYAFRTLDADGENSALTIPVNKGDELQFSAGTLPDDSNEYPAGVLNFTASFEKGEDPAPTEPSVKPTQPTEPSAKPTQPTEPSAKPTQPTEPSVKPTQPTEPSVKPTQPTEPSAKPTQPTEPAVKPTQPTEPSVKPTQPTEPAVKPTQPTEPDVTVPTTPPSDDLFGDYTPLYGGEIKAYHVTTGTNRVGLLDGELTYFLFVPERSGIYQFSGSQDLRYFGTNMAFINDQTGTVNKVNNTFTVNIKESSLGASYLLAMNVPAGVNQGTLTITRTGDAQLEWDDLPYEVYKGTYKPQPWTFKGGSLTYVDVTTSLSKYNLVLGSDGYYHLNSADGPLMYLNLGCSSKKPAKEEDITLYAMLNSNRPIIQGTVKDASGNNLYKRQYNDLVQQYIDCSSSGLYPLTADLVEILKTQNDNWYFWLRSENSRVTQNMAWMANICFVQ